MKMPTMMYSRLIFLFAITSMITSSHAQQIFIFIDQVPEYFSLDSCAVLPLSTIVKNMVDGCGDGSRTTSYNCFCSTSSAHFKDVIATQVSSHCSGTMSHVVRALDVFQSYCKIGATVTGSSCKSMMSCRMVSKWLIMLSYSPINEHYI
jgi:hypothetical protein